MAETGEPTYDVASRFVLAGASHTAVSVTLDQVKQEFLVAFNDVLRQLHNNATQWTVSVDAPSGSISLNTIQASPSGATGLSFDGVFKSAGTGTSTGTDTDTLTCSKEHAVLLLQHITTTLIAFVEEQNGYSYRHNASSGDITTRVTEATKRLQTAVALVFKKSSDSTP